MSLIKKSINNNKCIIIKIIIIVIIKVLVTSSIFTINKLGNLIGTAAVAGFLAYSTEVFMKEPFYSGLHELVISKVSLDWQIIILKGVGCNILVCFAIYCSTGAEEIVGKILIVYTMISATVFMSYEHSIANSFLVPVGLMYGAPITITQYLTNSLLPSSFGNLIGGSILGCLTYYLYLWGEVVPFQEKTVLAEGRRIPLHIDTTTTTSTSTQEVSRLNDDSVFHHKYRSIAFLLLLSLLFVLLTYSIFEYLYERR